MKKEDLSHCWNCGKKLNIIAIGLLTRNIKCSNCGWNIMPMIEKMQKVISETLGECKDK